jgi:hypothetical protein
MNSSISAETAQHDQGSLSGSNSASSGVVETPDSAAAATASSSNMQLLCSSAGTSAYIPAEMAWPAEQLQQQQAGLPVVEQLQQQQQGLQDVHAAAADSTAAEADQNAAAGEAVAAGPRKLDTSLFVDGMRVSATRGVSWSTGTGSWRA